MDMSGLEKASPGEVAVVRLSVVGLGFYVILDAVAALEPGVSVSDHWSSVVSVVVLAAIGWAYPAMRPGLRVVVCLSLAFLAIVAAGVAVAHATTEGLDGVDLVGFLIFVAAGALAAVALAVGWQTRRTDGHRHIRRILLGAAGLVFAFEVLVPIGLAWIGTHRPAEPPDPANLDRAYSDVAVHTDDGLGLAAWYLPSKNGAAVITYPTRSGSVEQARMLADAGFGVLALDMRGYGESDGDPNAYGWASEPDLEAAASSSLVNLASIPTASVPWVSPSAGSRRSMQPLPIGTYGLSSPRVPASDPFARPCCSALRLPS